MRQIEVNMLKCVRNSCAKTLGNTRVFITRGCDGAVTLFGNTIAHFDGDLFITICDGGWRTATTKSRLNALLNTTGYRILQRKDEWRLFYMGQDRGPFMNNMTFYIGSGE